MLGCKSPAVHLADSKYQESKYRQERLEIIAVELVCPSSFVVVAVIMSVAAGGVASSAMPHMAQ